jgi:hypothetical protein
LATNGATPPSDIDDDDNSNKTQLTKEESKLEKELGVEGFATSRIRMGQKF